jgi:CRP/FNR family transcriptional regulator
MSRTDLANHLGLTLECLSRVLSRFKRAGLVTFTRTRITLCKPEELATLALHVAVNPGR